MYFLDTCAMIGYLKDETRFVRAIKNREFKVSKFQLMEMYYWALKEVEDYLAERYYESFAKYEVEISEQTLKNAMKTRIELQKKGLNLSYVDAIGYQYALDNGLRFVTSDPAFKNMKKVEFIDIE